MKLMPRFSRYKPAFLLLLFIVMGHSSIYAEVRDWQQDVNYKMNLYLDDAARTISGTAEITYTNNSPDTLYHIWFRMAPAARNPHSYTNSVLFRDNIGSLDNLPEEHWGNLTVKEAVSENYIVSFIPDRSIGYLKIDEGLLPEHNITFTINFTTKFPSGRASFRLAYQNGQYKAAYWYPQICPYTPKYGWTVNRYYGTAESYGEIADYEINYNIPNRFILASTGYLVNEAEVLSPDRFQGLELNNPNPSPIPVGEDAEKRVSWKYIAEDVPEVAWVADPSFLIERINFDNYEAWSFVRRGRQKEWHDAAEIIGWTIEQLEDIYGPYPWPRVMATDSWSAMEYPMLTMMSWQSPDYHYVMMHEVIHNYTPMIIHSNSVDCPFLDEGFTTFVEHELAERYAKTKWNRKKTYDRGLFSKEFAIQDHVDRGIRPYLESVLEGEDLPMVRGADVAEEYFQLRVSTYYKTPVMLNALRGVVGEEKFWNGMRTYYKNCKLKLVDEIDMMRSFEEGTGQDLGWFFKQFMYDNGDIDYGIEDYKIEEKNNKYESHLTIKREDDIILPVRLGIITESKDTLKYEIPFLISDDILPGYTSVGQWNQVHEPVDTVQVKIVTEKKPVKIILDPDKKYVDRNPFNNTTSDISVRVDIDRILFPLQPQPVDEYYLKYSVAHGYDKKSGYMLGLTYSGDYMEKENKFRFDFLLPLQNTGPDHFQFRFDLKHPLNRDFRPYQGIFSTGVMHGDSWIESGIEREWRAWKPYYHHWKVNLSIGAWERDYDFSKAYSNYFISENETNGYLTLSLKYWTPRKKQPFVLKLDIFTGIDNKPFSTVEINAEKKNYRFAGFKINTGLRSAYISDKTPSGFMSSPWSGISYFYRGDPLWGALWSGENGSIRLPVPDETAILSCKDDIRRINGHISVKIDAERSLPRFMTIDSISPIKRFLQQISYGIYSAGSYYKYTESDLSVIKDGVSFESGIELNIKDLYDFSLSARNALISGNREGNSFKWILPGDWKDDDWANFTTIFITFSTKF